MQHLIDKYHNLQGQKVSREYLIEFTQQLFDYITENETALIIWKRIHQILDTYPDTENFKFENVDAVQQHGLNGLLYGLDESDIIDDGYNTGLNKAVKPTDIYDMITNRMKDLIKKASGSGYKKKWKARVYGKGYLIPFNFVSKKRYRGVNHFLLTNFEPLENPFFLTFKQVDKLGGKIKKGSFGHEVIYFTKLYKYEQAEPKLEFSTYDKKKMIKFLNDNKDKINLFKVGFTAEAIATQSYLPILKYYNVFNGKDIEGIDFDLDNFKTGYVNNPLPAMEENKMPIAEAIIDNYPDPKPHYRFGGDRAYYSSADYIQMPYIADFETAQDYYRTYFHEIGHSTGVAKRLGRDMRGKFGSKKYAFEELVAEWSAVFLSAEAGIVFHSNMNHAEYLKNWNTVLTKIKDDNKFIMRACTEAQKAADFVLQFDADGNPKYLKELKVEAKKGKSKSQKKNEKPSVEIVKDPAERQQLKNAIQEAELLLKGGKKSNGKKYTYEDKYILIKSILNNKLKLGLPIDKTRLLELEPKGFAIKPKSTTVETAIKDVLKLKKYKGKASQRQAKLLYSMFNNDVDVTLEEVSDIEKTTALDRKSSFHEHSRYDIDEDQPDLTLDVELTELGKDFIDAVNRRLQSLVNQDNNLALFDGLKASVQTLDYETVYLDLKTEPAPEPQNEVPAVMETTSEPTPEKAQLFVENKPVEQTEPEPQPQAPKTTAVPSKYKTAARAKEDSSKPREWVNIIDADLKKFLGGLEIKPVQSLAITLDSGEGGGKTHTFYRWANIMQNSGLRSIIWSLEQHESSSLAIGLAEKYFTNGNINRIAVESEKDGESKEETYNRILESINDFDAIFIDSWAKVMELNSIANFDQDFRKAFNGKIFFIIFQRTSDGKMRGGAKGGFDGDIILKVNVDRDDFSNNYVYNHKNRYNNHIPLSELKYSPFYGKLITEETEPEPKEEPKPYVSSSGGGIVYS